MRKKEKMVGKKFGWIEIVGELNPRNGHRRFITKCRECKTQEQIWHSDLSTGNYGKCNCEFKDMHKNVVYVK